MLRSFVKFGGGLGWAEEVERNNILFQTFEI